MFSWSKNIFFKDVNKDKPRDVSVVIEALTKIRTEMTTGIRDVYPEYTPKSDIQKWFQLKINSINLEELGKFLLLVKDGSKPEIIADYLKTDNGQKITPEELSELLVLGCITYDYSKSQIIAEYLKTDNGQKITPKELGELLGRIKDHDYSKSQIIADYLKTDNGKEITPEELGELLGRVKDHDYSKREIISALINKKPENERATFFANFIIKTYHQDTWKDRFTKLCPQKNEKDFEAYKASFEGMVEKMTAPSAPSLDDDSQPPSYTDALPTYEDAMNAQKSVQKEAQHKEEKPAISKDYVAGEEDHGTGTQEPEQTPAPTAPTAEDLLRAAPSAPTQPPSFTFQDPEARKENLGPQLDQ